MKLNAVVILLCFVVVACTSKPTDAPKSTKAAVTTAVSYIDSTWELGEVKSCMEQTFKGEDAPILLCSDHAGAAFFMTAGAMETAKNEATRTKLRQVFAKQTKNFLVSFDERKKDSPPMWECQKTETELHCWLYGTRAK